MNNYDKFKNRTPKQLYRLCSNIEQDLDASICPIEFFSGRKCDIACDCCDDCCKCFENWLQQEVR